MGGQVLKIKIKRQNKKIRNVMGKLRNAGQETDCELASCHGGKGVHCLSSRECLKHMLKETSICNFVLKC